MKTYNLLSVLLISMLFCITSTFANNIQVDSVSIEDQDIGTQTCYIEFDISWDNSWNVSTIPNNWDAAWVFVKYNVAGSGWYHATVFQTMAPSGCIMQSVGADSTGVWILRNGPGSGSNDWDNCRVKWWYGLDGVNNDAIVEISVFAIEMVYVPAGSYYLGDRGSLYRFHKGDDTTSAYEVASEAAIPLGTGATQLGATGNFSGTNPLPADYSKGFDSFYCMKYEIS